MNLQLHDNSLAKDQLNRHLKLSDWSDYWCNIKKIGFKFNPKLNSTAAFLVNLICLNVYSVSYRLPHL